MRATNAVRVRTTLATLLLFVHAIGTVMLLVIMWDHSVPDASSQSAGNYLQLLAKSMCRAGLPPTTK